MGYSIVDPMSENTMLLEKRLTHHYVGTYRHLDDWENIGECEIMNSAEMKGGDEEDYCEPRLSFLYLKVFNVKDGIGEDSIADAIYDKFSRHGCACSHDCCGCRSYQVMQAEKCKKFNYEHRGTDYQVWMVLVESSRNY